MFFEGVITTDQEINFLANSETDLSDSGGIIESPFKKLVWIVPGYLDEINLNLKIDKFFPSTQEGW